MMDTRYFIITKSGRMSLDNVKSDEDAIDRATSPDFWAAKANGGTYIHRIVKETRQIVWENVRKEAK